MQLVKSFTVDLTKISGRGDFKCPGCGVMISPEDTTEDTYTILKTIMSGENLDKIALRCSKCKSLINLTGFHIQDEVR
jgi:predicted nucleic-acid-binding Zn-ribbon protein